MLEHILISPPFGEWIKHIPKTSNVVGSLTVPIRKGRYSQAIKTIRPVCGKNSWINKIGLRTKGIEAFRYQANEKEVLSIAAIEYADWQVFLQHFKANNNYGFQHIEINVGCPNTLTQPLIAKDILPFTQQFKTVLIKVPPKESSIPTIEGFLEQGISHFHLSNTYPTKRGGVSGEILKKINIRLLQQLDRNNLISKMTLIAGGGIYTLDDVKQYQNLGATHFSLSTVFYNPLKGLQLVKKIKQHLNRTALSINI